MVPLGRFDSIVYKKPRFFLQCQSLCNIEGFDSEAYPDGSPFLYCTSRGDVLPIDGFFDVLFRDYKNVNFVTWNLKYETGAIVRLMPRGNVFQLQEDHETMYRGHRVTYIPHKRLKFLKRGRNGYSITFWDISPFYDRVSLEHAASKYLKKHKLETNPNLFTREYVARNFEWIKRYCINDAVLTKELTVLWMRSFLKTNVPIVSLFSEASLSLAYISRQTTVDTVYRYWEGDKRLLRYAQESYEGGKFEVTHRGSFTGYEYDISSAYPWEISNLLSTDDATVHHGKKYIDESDYAFLRVRIRTELPRTHLPCGIMRTVRLYPMGVYYLTITKQEYDYITRLPGVTVDIIDGAWMVMARRRYPYRDLMTELYNLKREYKTSDPNRSRNYKIIMNGFYGKMAQCIRGRDGRYYAGSAWNPIHASVITANVRIRITELQNRFPADCLAVHTDSVIMKSPVPGNVLGTGLGQFEKVHEGAGVIVACGIYEINGIPAVKGFRKYSVMRLLSENPGRSKITIPVRHVYSWMQAMAQNHDQSEINVFSTIPKILDLNCDAKRSWEKSVTSTDLLNNFYESFPKIENQHSIPEHWK